MALIPKWYYSIAVNAACNKQISYLVSSIQRVEMRFILLAGKNPLGFTATSNHNSES